MFNFNTLASLGQAATAILSIVALVYGSFRFFVLRPLDARIKDATKQIQPGANGGQSLTDVNKKVDRLAKSVDDLGHRLDRIEERNLEIYDHLLDLVSRRNKRRKTVEPETLDLETPEE
jgi:hypothetical protein